MISRGQIYLVNLNPTQGREQKGLRPVLVVSADAINQHPLVVTVVAATDAANVPRDYPTNVRVPARESGLPTDTIFLCFQLRAHRDNEFYLAWDKVSESAEATRQYLEEWVYGVKDRNEYWEKLGSEAHRRLEVPQNMSQPINYGRY